MPRTLVVMAHFGDPFWLEGAVSYWVRAGIKDFVISHQVSDLSLKNAGELRRKMLVSNPDIYLEFLAVTGSKEKHASFDHAAAIDQLRTYCFSYLNYQNFIISDPDAWVIQPALMSARLTSATKTGSPVLVADHKNLNMSHPCVAVVPADIFFDLDLRAGMADFRQDFGRGWAGELGIDMSGLNFPIQLKPYGAYFYPNLGVLHFSSQSFVGSHWLTQSMLPWRRRRAIRPRRDAEFLLERKPQGFDGEHAIFAREL